MQHYWDWLITSQKKGGEISPHVGTEISFFFFERKQKFPSSGRNLTVSYEAPVRCFASHHKSGHSHQASRSSNWI